MTVNISKRLVSYSQNINNERNFWVNQLSGELQKSYFPYDYDYRNIYDSSRGDSVRKESRKAHNPFRINDELHKRLMKIANGSENNVYAVLLSGLILLLNRYTGNNDIIVAVPIYKQEQEGEFINTVLAIRKRLQGNEKVKDLLMHTRKSLFEANEHMNFPLERLISELDNGVDNNVAGNGATLLETAILMENIHNREYIRHINPNMQFSFLQGETSLEGDIEYNARLYEDASVRRIAGHFENILQEMVTRLNACTAEIEVLTPAQKRHILEYFNRAKRDIPADKTIHLMFEEQVERGPAAAAVVYGSTSAAAKKLSFRELNGKANQLARLLREKGVKPGDIVGIMAEPAVEMPLAIIAVMKAGAAYLPVDPEFPANRIDYMLKDSQAQCILTQKQHMERFAAAGDRLTVLDIENPGLYRGDASNREPLSTAGSILYTIYTSGTSGKPKGVLLKNENLVNYVAWFSEKIGITVDDKTMLASSFAYDLGYTVFYPPLLAGGQLHLVPRDIYLSPENMLEYLRENAITYIKLTPSLFSVIVKNPRFPVEADSALRLVVLGGEAINVADVAYAYSRCKHLQIMNHYGPSEAAIGAVAHIIDRGWMDEYKRTPTIGKPIDNTGVYILDRNMKPVPVGVPAELCIGGNGVGAGYLNRPELTAEKFIYRSYCLYFSKKIYKTGDLARWLPDGNIEFLGRIDQQVKIRGYRIELGEIENQLKRHQWVKDALVIDIGKGGDKYLCGYIVTTPGSTAAGEGRIEKELRETLAGELPDYMVPRHYVIMDSIPLTPNGKVDRKRLPEPRSASQGKNDAPPVTALERRLVEIWEELLELPQESIGIDDSFFELGGHSLKAIMLISNIHKEMDVKIPLTEMFIISTIRKLAQYIEEAETDKYRSMRQVEEKEYYPVSSAQMRLYILQQMNPRDSSYNIPRILKLEGYLDQEKLAGVFAELIHRHEGLRTVVEMQGGKPVQRIKQQLDFAVEKYEAQSGEEEKIIRKFVRPFDLSRAPLLRLGMLKTGLEHNLLMVDMHHIISDGVTVGLVIEDLMAIYGGRQLEPLQVRYKDYSQWQQSDEGKEAVRKQEAFWLEEFKGEVPVLNLPGDYERPPEKSFEGRHVRFEIGKKETEALRKLALKEETTLYMIFLVVFKVLLARISGQEDIVVGLPTAGRRHTDLQRIVGVFVNTLSLRSAPAPGKTLAGYIGEITAKTLKAFENQDYQFEELVEKVAVNRDVSRNPLFDVLFVLQNMEIPELVIRGLKLEPYENETRVARFDLSMMGIEAEDSVFFTVEFCTALFREETVRKFIVYFRTVVAALIETPGKRIGDIQLLTHREKAWLVEELNGTAADYPRDKTLYQIFAEQAERTPGNTAVIDKNRELTYRQLHEKSHRLAVALREKGIVPDTVAAIMTKRSLEMVVGIFGILGAGGAYLPIDPEYPRKRIDFMLRDSNARVLLSEVSELSHISEEVIVVNPAELKGEFPHYPTHPLTGLHSAVSLCYVIYTSGSTGRPKGVAMEHRAAVNRLNWMQKAYPIGENDVILQKTTYVFDVSVWELFWWSQQGAAVALPGPGEEKNPEAIIAAIESHGVTTMHFVPSMLNIFLEYVGTGLDINRMRSLKQVFASGEELSPYQVNRFNKLLNNRIGTRLINLYGPTEAAVDVSYYNCPGGENRGIIPIGKPIDNIKLFVVNKNFKLQPPGIAGQLCIAGDGLARGYLNRPGLTAEKFIPSPFTFYFAKLYQTGDLARLLPDGSIQYLGRRDYQVKIRGFRIELGEIENQLRKHERIIQTVVLAEKDKKGDDVLTAYVVPGSTENNDTKEFNALELKTYLAQRLADYMIPARFVKLDKIPLTFNGKVDRRALRTAGAEMETGVRYVAPKSEGEKIIARIWAEELGLERVGTQENFFELGGTSLKIIQVNLRLKEEMKRDIPVVAMFRYPKVSQLAGYLDRAGDERPERLTADQRADTMEKGKSKLKNLRKRMRTG